MLKVTSHNIILDTISGLTLGDKVYLRLFGNKGLIFGIFDGFENNTIYIKNIDSNNNNRSFPISIIDNLIKVHSDKELPISGSKFDKFIDTLSFNIKGVLYSVCNNDIVAAKIHDEIIRSIRFDNEIKDLVK